jgi:hypothetical protein
VPARAGTAPDRAPTSLPGPFGLAGTAFAEDFAEESCTRMTLRAEAARTSVSQKEIPCHLEPRCFLSLDAIAGQLPGRVYSSPWAGRRAARRKCIANIRPGLARKPVVPPRRPSRRWRRARSGPAAGAAKSRAVAIRSCATKARSSASISPAAKARASARRAPSASPPRRPVAEGGCSAARRVVYCRPSQARVLPWARSSS